GVVENMLNVSGVPTQAVRNAPGGWRLRQHFNGEVPKNGKFKPTPEVLKTAAWDYVVLQEQSAGTVNEREEYLEFGAKMVDLARENCAETTVLLYQTWGRCDGMFAGYGADDAKKAETIAAWEKRYNKKADETVVAALKDGIQGGVAALAEKSGAAVAPVGEAFERVKNETKIDLYADEKGQKPHHPNPTGTYMAGCVFFKTITGKSPVGLFAKLTEAGKAPKDVDAEDAATLEKIADEVVKK
ncbi:MAG: hypothetical protein IJO46_15445, partial [Thermoguttaceae bacterium]|nr:hypothetical protein [Thermoguttaceae bacterium]